MKYQKYANQKCFFFSWNIVEYIYSNDMRGAGNLIIAKQRIIIKEKKR